ncbi:MAG: cytochrome c oxidase subunit 3 [Pseudohongiellaceae bacterium]
MNPFRHVITKPWEKKGVIGGLRHRGAFDTPPARVGLVFFLFVATVLFFLFSVAYNVRMTLPDWQPLAAPGQLWLNTGLLVVSSALFQWARNIVRRDITQDVQPHAQAAQAQLAQAHPRNLMMAFVGAGLFAFLFIAGQLMVWDGLYGAGYSMASNPANSFFYLLTGVHGAHLLGGLWVWSKSLIRLLSGGEVKDVRLSIELCTLYWHFLLVVWLVMFALLAN